jgi:periplasmic divalent cation tolerance protein
MQPIFVYVTIGSVEEAETLSKQLVEDKLVACANIYPDMRSVYAWEGKVICDKEVSIILKTCMDVWERLRERIVELHPYECPAILVLPIQEGHQPYLQWLYDTTAL